MTRSRIAVLAIASLSAVLVWALPAGAQSSNVRTTKITNVTVLAGRPSEFGFKLSKTRVPKGVVVFTVKNMGAIAHDFKIAGKKTRLLNPGQSATLRVTFTKTGKSAYLCTVPSHAIAGMKGTLTVTA
jgi:uncharacterized cupredoxin-like copper-binding protein